jgi:hypothetical protein
MGSAALVAESPGPHGPAGQPAATPCRRASPTAVSGSVESRSVPKCMPQHRLLSLSPIIAPITMSSSNRTPPRASGNPPYPEVSSQ